MVAANGLTDLRFTASPTRGRGVNVLVVGWNRRSRRELDEAKRDGRVRLIAVLDDEAWPGADLDADPAAETTADISADSLFGKVDDLEEVLRTHPVDEVLITLPIKSRYDQIQRVIRICEEAGTPYSLSTDLFENRIARLRPGPGSRKITFSCVHYPTWKLAIKRCIDIVGAVVGLALLALPMALIAFAIRLTSRGPALFAQERVGLNHKRFKMYKFRTMVVNAEELQTRIAHLNEQEGPVFKIREDPRITRLGALLRRFSLDELPQFFNVLKGEMSLVGPRPPIQEEVVKYEWWQRRRLSMRPGLTCYWQVLGRNDIGFGEWMRLDLKYIDTWSLWTDVKLILQTFGAVARGSGR